MRIRSHLILAAISSLSLAAPCAEAGSNSPDIGLTPLGSYREEAAPGVCRKGIAEFSAYDALSRRVFVTNPVDNAIDIISIGKPGAPELVKRVEVADLAHATGFQPTGIAARPGLVAVALAATNPATAPGRLLFLGPNGRLLRPPITVGAGRGTVAFSPGGGFLVDATGGEGSGADDPEGQVTVVDLRNGLHASRVAVADFRAFNSRRAALIKATVRLNPSAATVAQDLEPTSLAVTSRTAYVTLEHNNALATVDLRSASVTAVLPFGYKDHSQAGNGLDPSRDDGGIHIGPWPVLGAYEANGIAVLGSARRTFIVTANDGDPRPDNVESDEPRNPLLNVDPSLADLRTKEKLGRLEVSTLAQDADPDGVGDGAIHQFVSFGGRSFAIWDTSALTPAAPVAPVYDSGDQMEQITAQTAPAIFNAKDDDNGSGSFDNRSPRRGPEPKRLAIGWVGGHRYVFLGLRKQGGIILADVTNPGAPGPLAYASTRLFDQDANVTGTTVNCTTEPSAPGRQSDLGPEGLLFIPALLSPSFRPLLVVNFVTSGSTRIFEVDRTVSGHS